MSTERFFDHIASRYDRTFAPDAASTTRDLGALLANRQGTVLNLGCDTERAFPHLVAINLRVIGLDVSFDMLRKTSRRSSSAHVTRMRADLYAR